MKKLGKCLISAGPTREWIDSVRYLSNPSSGKMGFELARSAVEKGLDVTLVSGPVSLSCPEGVNFVSVETAIGDARSFDQFLCRSRFNDYVSRSLRSSA